MPGIAHEGPIELLRRNPRLAAALLEGSGVPIPTGASAAMATGDVTSVPTELRADAVIVLAGQDATVPGRDARLAVVVEVQQARAGDKRRVWPAYLALARAEHDCPTVLLVICPDPATGRWARQPIATGHPGFDLMPLVIDAGTTPAPGAPGLSWAAPELAVLCALTGAADLDRDADRRLILTAIAAARLDEDSLETYTRLVRAVASVAARNALEALMTTTFKDDFIDRYKAEGAAGMVLRILAARGIEVPGQVRERVRSCTDLGQLETWADKAATAASLQDVFTGDE